LFWFILTEVRARRSNETGQSKESGIPARIVGGLWAFLTMLLVIWAGYRFSIGPVLIPGLISAEHHDRYAPLLASHLVSNLVSTPIPAPEFFRGIAFQYSHNARGHIGYLLGQLRQSGWWYFFPVVLAFKTPLPSLILATAGSVGLFRRSWRDRQ